MKKKLIKKFIILFAVIVLFTPAKANAEKIDIAKDIAGFKYYLCDDDLIIEWTESINGYVSITAMDTVTTEIFYKDNIKTNQSIIPIKGISEVYVTVESRNYNTIQFLTSTIYQPSGTVVFNTPSQTNKENAECSVILDDSYFIEIYLEDKLVEKTDLYEIGEYEFNIPISAGNNYITAYIVDVKGNKKSYSTIISRDIAAPVLNLTKDYDMVSTTDDVINISGSVYDYKVLTINGVQINVEENGNFSFDYSLLDGNNNIVIIALDNVGNVAEYSATVSKVAQIEKENNTWMTVAIIVIFVVAVLCVLYKKNIIKISAFRRGDNDEENSIGTEIVDEQEEDVDERVQNGHINQDKSNTIIGTMIFLLPIIIFAIIYYVGIYFGNIKSGSMEPNIMIGEKILANKLAYVFNEPQRGDVIVFYSQEKKVDMVKRVIGVAGDKIEFIDGEVVINGHICVEDYLPYDTETNADYDFVVPEGTVFVLGDNRDSSWDSRYWNEPYIDIDDIYGKVFYNF